MCQANLAKNALHTVSRNNRRWNICSLHTKTSGHDVKPVWRILYYKPCSTGQTFLFIADNGGRCLIAVCSFTQRCSRNFTWFVLRLVTNNYLRKRCNVELKCLLTTRVYIKATVNALEFEGDAIIEFGPSIIVSLIMINVLPFNVFHTIKSFNYV